MKPPRPPVPALERAIADPPTLAEIRDESDLAGLARRVVRPIDLLGHSVAVVSPSASALIGPFILHRVVGPGAWLSAVIGFGLAFLLASVFSQFATRIAAPGSMYTWVTRAIGPLGGLLVAASMLMGYGTLVAFGASQSVRYGTEVGTSSGWGTPGPGAQLLLVAAAVLLCVVVSVRGVGLSTRVAFAAETALVLSLLVLVTVALTRDGLVLDGLFSLQGADAGRILVGASLVMLVTVGFESSASLAGEVEKPFLSVPRSLTGTIAISATLYGLSFLAAHSIRTANGGVVLGPAQRWFPAEVDVVVADAVVSALMCVGFLALALCALNAVARVIFSLAREGLLPGPLGWAHPRRQSPYVALGAVAPFALVPAVITTWGGHPIGSLTGKLLSAAVLVLLIAYVLVAIAVPFLLVGLGEWTWGVGVSAVAAAVLSIVVVSAGVVDDFTDRTWLACVLAASALLGGACWYAYLVVRRPDALRRMGIHDETIASDLLRR